MRRWGEHAYPHDEIRHFRCPANETVLLEPFNMKRFRQTNAVNAFIHGITSETWVDNPEMVQAKVLHGDAHRLGDRRRAVEFEFESPPPAMGERRGASRRRRR